VCENTFTLKAPIIALSTDEGRTVTPIAAFHDVAGPVDCGGKDAGAAAICTQSWPEMRALILPRETPDASDTFDGDASGDAGGAPSPTPRNTCGCTLVGADALPDPMLLTSGLLPLVAWARARKRRGSPRAHSGPR
jgi:hypothetical protein